jgi:Flp pilus assembly protein TadB
MTAAILAAVAVMICMLIFMSYQDYKDYDLRRRINRMLIRRQPDKFNLFAFLGETNDKLVAAAADLIPGMDPDMFIIYGLYVMAGVIAAAGIMGNILYGLLLDVLIIVLTMMYLDNRRSNRIYKLEQQFGAFARDVSVYLRANPNLYRAIESVTEYAGQPLRQYLDAFIRRVESGEPIDESLKQFKTETNIDSISEWVDSIIFARMAKSDITDVCDHSADRINRKLVRGMNIHAVLSKTKGAAFAMLGLIALMVVYTILSSPDTKDLILGTGTGQMILIYVIASLFITTYIIMKQIDGITKQ